MHGDIRKRGISAPPPASERELLDRARDLAGRTLGEIAAGLEVPVPSEPRRGKGFAGALAERALGADAGTSARPDFVRLGIELKTVPVRPDGRPAESTFVCTVPLEAIAELEWEDSPVCAKLARVLFLPIESDRALPLAARRVGAPFLWSPGADEDAGLRADWDELAGLLGSGHVERVTAHLGRFLQVRPKAATSRVRGRAPEAGGAWVATVPRGFYLRARFTAQILRDGL